MLLRENVHNATVNALEDRLREIHPNDEIFTDYEYGKGSATSGQVDLYRISEHGRFYFYEVKTGKPKFKNAQEQFDRFKKHFPEYAAKGIYVHPEHGIKRLK